MSYRAAVLADNPIAYWRLGEANGVAVDEVAGYEATYSGTPTYGVEGLLLADANKAVSLATAYAVAEDIPSLDQMTKFTIECIVKPDTLNSNAFVSITHLGASTKAVLFSDSGTDLYLQLNGNVNLGPVANVFTLNTTKHLVATYDSVTGHGELWVNGEMRGEFDVTAGTVPQAASELWIGKATFGYQMNGVEDEVAVYGHILADARIETHYAESISPSSDNNDIFEQEGKLIEGDALIPGGPFIAASGLVD